ncbi:hypothetical protein F2Q68_00002382 [Brassica cretica]|uniref:Gnk2-homologous domain-containing protein n=1 Tax=Brassica cretica TaxID=69181 RepID=A0A8S9JA43_BRACR|nr:hypothetical protein F2Q68_00002382 [Brassica cretica]
MTLFMQPWESAVNKTLETATQANTSSVHKYYSAIHAHFTEFPNVNMAMQCTPDITSQDCKQCLGDCVEYFREQFRGRAGGMASFPSCLFRWDNVTSMPALPRPLSQEKRPSSIPEKKGRCTHREIITTIVVATFINLLARKRWAEGRPEVIIDPLLGEKPSNKIIKLIQTGLLCVQQNATKRPTMSTVIVWLGSESTITIHSTKTPASTSSHFQSEDGTMSMSNVFTDLSCR